MPGGNVTPGVVESIEATAGSEPLVALALFAAFVIGRELIDDHGSADA
jgi:hypothetical protein